MDIRKKKKLGLVLSGGGIKAAAFHIGVCLALKEKGFRFAGGTKELVRQKYKDSPLTFKVYVGSSAGAFVSTILAAGYEVESLINAFQLGLGHKPLYKEDDINYLKPIGYRDLFALNGSRMMRFLPDVVLKKSLVSGGIEAFLKNGFKLNGLCTTKGLEKYLRKDALVENDFSRLGVELYVVATQLNHTRKAIFGNFDEGYKTSSTMYINHAAISEAVACSTALPPVFAPYSIKKEAKELYFFDGEIRETLSAHIAADHGCDLVISSYSLQPYHYTPEMGSLHEYGIPVIINQALYQVLEQKISKHIEWQSQLKDIYKALDRYFKENKIGEEHRKNVLDMIQSRVNFRPEVDYIFINPRPQNYEMFFVDHFSLNPRILERIVRIGFKSTINVLRRYDI
jgi:predicted acylesterase/phospholipase RssA